MSHSNTSEPFCTAPCKIQGVTLHVFFFWPEGFDIRTPDLTPITVFEDRSGQMIPHDVPVGLLGEIEIVA